MFNPYLQYMYSYPHKTAYRTIPALSLAGYFPRLSGSGHGLYLHIPFCQTKCGYCNLFSVTGCSVRDMDEYLSAVKRQAVQYASLLPKSCRFSDFTVGGGTPLLLSPEQLDRMFAMLHSMPFFSEVRDMVIETAPNQTTKEKLRLLKQAGVTRVSMGIQSFSDTELKTLARRHRGAKAREALDLLMSEGFPCVNLDFIYGIPGQTEESLLKSLKEALRFAPEELFLYPLYLNHGAGLEKQVGREIVLEPQKAYRQYQKASRFLKESGYRQDSMRRFVRMKNIALPKEVLPEKTFLNYGITEDSPQDAVRKFSDCGFGTSLALGCGGRSYLGNLHFCTPYAITQKGCRRQLSEFMQTEDFTKITHGFFLSEEEQKRRYIIRHLLIYPGLDEREYRKHFQCEAREDFPLLNQWINEGYLTCGTFLALTELGLGLSDYLGPQMISPEVRQRMEEWEAIYGQKNDSLPGKPEKL